MHPAPRVLSYYLDIREAWASALVGSRQVRCRCCCRRRPAPRVLVCGYYYLDHREGSVSASVLETSPAGRSFPLHPTRFQAHRVSIRKVQDEGQTSRDEFPLHASIGRATTRRDSKTSKQCRTCVHASHTACAKQKKRTFPGNVIVNRSGYECECRSSPADPRLRVLTAAADGDGCCSCCAPTFVLCNFCLASFPRLLGLNKETLLYVSDKKRA